MFIEKEARSHEPIFIEQVEMELVEETIPQKIVLTSPIITLPILDESDAWVNAKLPELTWRTEIIVPCYQ